MAVGTKDYMMRLGDEVFNYFYQDNFFNPYNHLENLPDGQYQFSYELYGLTGESMRKMIEISDTWEIPVKFFDNRLTFTPEKFDYT